MTTKQFLPGQVIKIHPASDWFMRGESYATIVKVGRKWLHVRGHRSNRVFKLAPRNAIP